MSSKKKNSAIYHEAASVPGLLSGDFVNLVTNAPAQSLRTAEARELQRLRTVRVEFNEKLGPFRKEGGRIDL